MGGYLASLIAYAAQNWGERDGAQTNEGGDPIMVDPERGQEEGESRKRYLLRTALIQKDPVLLQLYHFLPLVRFYLLVKDKTRGDVEAVFRVNGLSTFTIGLAQMFCIALGVMHNAISMSNLFVQIGLFAQCVNLTITVIDYFTRTCETLKTSIEIDNLMYQMKEDKNRELVAFERAFRLASDDPTNKNLADDVESLHRQLEQEIQHMARIPVDMSWLRYIDKIDIRQQLKIKQILARQ